MNNYANVVSILATAALVGISPPLMAQFARGQETELVVAAERADQLPREQVRVVIKLFQFQPRHIEVKLGTTVTWTNEDEIYHTITADDQGFSAPVDAKGKAFSFTFNRPGTYAYHCERHDHMRGTVEVR